MHRPSVVCFDLGGVLVRICRSWEEACVRAQLPVRDAEWLRSAAALARRRDVIFAYQRGELTTMEYCDQMSRALDQRYSADEVQRVHDAWLIDEYDGVRALVEELAARRDLRTACLSNTNERHWSVLVSEVAPPMYPSVMALDARFASHLLRSSKPDTAIFRAFETAFDVRPEEILFFDDTADNVSAARARGWRAECIDPSGNPGLQLRACLAAVGLGPSA